MCVGWEGVGGAGVKLTIWGVEWVGWKVKEWGGGAWRFNAGTQKRCFDGGSGASRRGLGLL